MLTHYTPPRHTRSPRPLVCKSSALYFRSFSAEAVCGGSGKGTGGGGGATAGRRQPVRVSSPRGSYHRGSCRTSLPSMAALNNRCYWQSHSNNLLALTPPSPPPSSSSSAASSSKAPGLRHQQQRTREGSCGLAVCMPNPYTTRLSKDSLSLPSKKAVEYLTSTTFTPVTAHDRVSRPFLPPAPMKKKTLVLDMDETLVHCSLFELPSVPVDFTVNIDNTRGYVYLRPFVRSFLQQAAALFEVLVFTASTQTYADQVMDTLDPAGNLFAHRLYREHCTVHNGGYIKDLRKLGRPLGRTLLVDNSPISLALQLDNGIVVSSWFGDAYDNELQHLLALLQILSLENTSVTTFLTKAFSLRKWVNSMRVGSHPL